MPFVYISIEYLLKAIRTRKYYENMFLTFFKPYFQKHIRFRLKNIL